MTQKRVKYIFLFCSALLLVFMLMMSRKAGVTCDEVLHYNHSLAVYNWFATLGKDQSALNTPVSHLQYYGQSYDNIVTILIKWFGIEDIYTFRHIMSTLAGWMAIMITALFAIWISGYGTGIMVLLLFAVSPTFLGHAQNNLKDIPFALGYIAGVFYILKHLLDNSHDSRKNTILLIVSIAFCISIRAGGLVLICYLFLFWFISEILKYIDKGQPDFREIRNGFLKAVLISFLSYILSIILWPYAIQNPVLNPLKSYHVMLQFPDTFRQIFEGKVEWSDFMPWYYLPEYMAITIPLIVIAGLVLFIVFSGRIFRSDKAFVYLSLFFTLIFPVVFVILERSNLYSGWRHFLFVYPGIIVLASTGWVQLLSIVRRKYLTLVVSVIMVLMAYHPMKFMLSNPEYSYIYFNEIAGGLRGAYGRYETDYYFVSLKEASEWLIKDLDEKQIKTPVKVMANFSVNWFFRKHPDIQTSYARYEERSQKDWDYAIITNRYISTYQLINRIWPPDDALKVIYADGVPVCAIVERKSKDDLYGYRALEEGRTEEAIRFFEKALKKNDKDEMIYFNFASALVDKGEFEKADSALKKCLEVNPDFDLALMYLGNIAAANGKPEEATAYYEKVIKANRKYLEAYVELAKLVVDKDVMRSRDLLRSCLDIDPQYKSAIIALADTYRKSDPEVAKKYDDLANTIKQ
jgi:hypothetical protein